MYTGLVINHLNAGCLSKLRPSSRKAQLQTPSSRLNGGTWIESNICHACHEDGRAIQQTTHPVFTSQTSTCGSLAPLIDVAYTSWLPGAKDECQRSGAFSRVHR